MGVSESLLPWEDGWVASWGHTGPETPWERLRAGTPALLEAPCTPLT